MLNEILYKTSRTHCIVLDCTNTVFHSNHLSSYTRLTKVIFAIFRKSLYFLISKRMCLCVHFLLVLFVKIETCGLENEILNFSFPLPTVILVEQVLSSELTREEIMNLIVPVHLDSNFESLGTVFNLFLSDHPFEFLYGPVKSNDETVLIEFSDTMVFTNFWILCHSN